MIMEQARKDEEPGMIQFTSRQAEIVLNVIKDDAIIARSAARQIRKSIKETGGLQGMQANWIRHAFSYTPHSDFSDETRIILDVPGATRDEVAEIAELLA